LVAAPAAAGVLVGAAGFGASAGLVGSAGLGVTPGGAAAGAQAARSAPAPATSEPRTKRRRLIGLVADISFLPLSIGAGTRSSGATCRDRHPRP
jgi:hypothetical protein